jgi:hypothetical protein
VLDLLRSLQQDVGLWRVVLIVCFVLLTVCAYALVLLPAALLLSASVAAEHLKQQLAGKLQGGHGQ